MVTQTETRTETPVDPEPPQVETETPTPTETVGDESAAPEAEAAAPEVPQVEVTEPEKPDYITREEWEKERQAIARDAREQERRRRQTENARKAHQEQRDREEQQEAVDTIRAALVSQGIDPQIVTEEGVQRTVDRLARKKADRMAAEALQTIEPAWDYLTGVEADLDEQAAGAAKLLYPRLQALVNQIKPQIEAEARKGYIAESDLPQRVEAEIARRKAKAREGQEELKRPEGQPSVSDTSTVAERLDRIGTSRETPADRQWWNEREKARGRG